LGPPDFDAHTSILALLAAASLAGGSTADLPDVLRLDDWIGDLVLDALAHAASMSQADQAISRLLTGDTR
jgi:hypothetical protein